MLRPVMLVLLVAAVMVSALMVITTKNENRTLYAQLQDLRARQEHLSTVHAQLQLEQSAWSDRGRIQRLARTRLDMHEPGHYDIVTVQP